MTLKRDCRPVDADEWVFPCGGLACGRAPEVPAWADAQHRTGRWQLRSSCLALPTLTQTGKKKRVSKRRKSLRPHSTPLTGMPGSQRKSTDSFQLQTLTSSQATCTNRATHQSRIRPGRTSPKYSCPSPVQGAWAEGLDPRIPYPP